MWNRSLIHPHIHTCECVLYVVGYINTRSSLIQHLILRHVLWPLWKQRLHYWEQDIGRANCRDTKAKWRFRSATWTFTESQANWGMSLLHAASNTNRPENSWHVSTSCQHVGCVLTRLPPPSENIRKHQWIAKLFTVGIESGGRVCVRAEMCANVLLHVHAACVTGGESGRHYHHSALPTIRRHLTVWDHHFRVHKVTTSTVQRQTKGERVGGSNRSR